MPPSVTKLPVLIFLPYLGARSVQLKRSLNKFLANMYPHIEFRFVFQSTKRIGNFSILKIVPQVIFARQ